MPAFIWRKSPQKGECDVPKLASHLFAEISELDYNLFTDDPSDAELKESYMLEEEDCSALCISREVTTATT